MKRLAAISTGLWIAAQLTLASAGALPPACGTTLAGTATLDGDLHCATGHGLVLGPGAVLDCAGHRITGGGVSGQYGIYVRDGAGAVVRNCVAERFEVGIRLRGASRATVTDSVARDNLRYGIEVTSSSAEALIQRNAVLDNGDEGVHLSGPSDRDAAHQILDNTVAGNDLEGVYLLRSNGNLIAGNTIRDHGSAGIYVKGSARNTITGNTLVNDPLQLVQGATQNVLSDNILVGAAIKFSQAPNNRVSHLVVQADGGRPATAYELSGSSGNTIVDSETASPADCDIRAKSGSTNNVFVRFSAVPGLRCWVDKRSSVSVTDAHGAAVPCLR